MTEENPQNNDPQEDSSQPSGESSSLEPTREAQVEAKIDKIIQNLPPEQAQHTLREVIFGIIERGATPKLDPEALKIAAATVEKDNEYRFRYLSQKEENEAEQNKREHGLKEKQHDLQVSRYQSQVKMLWPILISAIILVLGCIAAGIYLAATGRDTLGFSILSGTISAVFAFLGGLGISHFFKGE